VQEAKAQKDGGRLPPLSGETMWLITVRNHIPYDVDGAPDGHDGLTSGHGVARPTDTHRRQGEPPYDPTS
jgi:hypothetical protein